MDAHLPSFDAKRVLDWDREVVGRVVGSQLSRATREPISLLVALDERAKDRLGMEEDALWLPYDAVFSIRRDEIRLASDAWQHAVDPPPNAEASPLDELLEEER